MKQVSESRVTEVLDHLAAVPDDDRTGLDMAWGAVHLAFLVGLIDSIEFHNRCVALDKARFGPKAKEQA